MSEKTVYHYLQLGRLGRGEVVRLFMLDAGIDFEEHLYPYPDKSWEKNSAELKEKKITMTGSLPAVIYKGVTLNQHIPIVRYLARDLGQYEGESNYDKYLVDAVSDAYIDWRAQWVTALISGVKDEYMKTAVPKYYSLMDQYYAKNNGPYLLGDKITYADFAVYQSCDNDIRLGAISRKELPQNLIDLADAMEKRPNIAQYLKDNAPEPK